MMVSNALNAKEILLTLTLEQKNAIPVEVKLSITYVSEARFVIDSGQQIYLLIVSFNIFYFNTHHNKSMIQISKIVNKLHQYFFPPEHTINIHHSTLKNPIFLFYIRVFALVLLSGVYLWSITLSKSTLVNFIYLTMQGYFITWLFYMLVVQDYLLNGGINSHLKGHHNTKIKCKNLKYFIQLVYQIAFCVQLPITLIFWTVLLPIMLSKGSLTFIDVLFNLGVHASPLILLSIDMCFNSFRFPRRHFHAVFFFQLFYSIINILYTLLAHIIYQPIDWISVMSYVLIVVTLLLTLTMHWLGRIIYRKWKKQKIQDQLEQQKILKQKLLGKDKKNKKKGKKNKAKKNKANVQDKTPGQAMNQQSKLEKQRESISTQKVSQIELHV